MLCHNPDCRSTFIMPILAESREDSVIKCWSCGAEGPLAEEDWAEVVEEQTRFDEVRSALQRAKEGEAEAIRELADHLKSPHRQIALEAARALGCVAHEESVRVLASAARSRVPEIRSCVIRQLGNVRLESAAKALARLLVGSEGSAPGEIQRALIRLGEVAVVPVLSQLHKTDGPAGGSLETVLEHINTEAAKVGLIRYRVDRILDLALTGDLVPTEAGDRLMALGWRAEEPLIEALDSGESVVRLCATRALLALGGRGAAVALQHARLDEDESISGLVEWGLQQLIDKGDRRPEGW